MLLSTNSEFYPRRIGFEKTVEKYAKVGFDAYDISLFDMPFDNFWFGKDDYEEKAARLRKIADENKIVCNQAHAPFPSHRDGDEAWNKNIKEYFERSLKISSALGAKVCVIHPWNDWDAKRNAEEVYLPLKPLADKLHVKIGVENMWNWDLKEDKIRKAACSSPEDFVKHLELLPKETFGACLDIGHAEMFEDVHAPDFIEALSDRLIALHVHDNDCEHDWHYFPYMGNIDWEKIYEALAKVDYKGDLTFEADHTFYRYPDALCDELLSLLYSTGRVMIEKINGYKKT